MQSKLSTPKTLSFVASILVIVVGGLLCFSMIGILAGIIDILGGIFTLKFHNLSDQDFIAKRGTLLVWGIILLLTSLLGGILLLVAYFQSNVQLQEDQPSENMMSLEKAFDLKEKGAITDEEYNRIKSHSLK